MYLCRASLLYKTLFSLLQGHLNEKNKAYIYIFYIYTHLRSSPEIDDPNRYYYYYINSLSLAFLCIPIYIYIFAISSFPILVGQFAFAATIGGLDYYCRTQNRRDIAFSLGPSIDRSNSSVQKKNDILPVKEEKNERNYIYIQQTEKYKQYT